MEYYRPMASQYLQPQRQQHVSYSPNKQTNGTQQVPATSMYTTSSGFQTFQTVLTPTYTDANGEHVTKIEPHDGEHQPLRVLMPVYQNATSSGTQIKFVDASGGGNSVIFSTSNGTYQQQQPQQYQTIQIANHQHGQIGHQIVNGQFINGSTGQQHFSSQPVQYIVVQSAPNGNVPLEIKSEIDPPMIINQSSSQDGSVRDVRRAKDANRKRRRRLTESEEEAMARRQKNLEAKRRRLARETDEERRRRRQRDAEAKRKRRERETEEQRLSRLKRDSERMRRTRRLKKLQGKDGVVAEIIQAESQQQQPQQPTHSRNSHQQQNNQHTVTVSNSMPPPTRMLHRPKQEPTSYLSSNSSAAINQTIAAVVDNKHSNMVVLDQKPLQQSAFISHPHTIQIPANSMVQTVAVPQGMLIPSSQGGHGAVQQIILLPPSGQPTNAITIPPGTQIIHQRHPDSSASSVSSSFITETVQQPQQSQQQSTLILPDDPTERQRIRNKERARRRRALETPEQRALRNMKTAERMRRRRAQLAEQRALEHGHSQPVKVNLTDEEYTHRFEDIFQCVLKRADYEVENNGPIVPRAKLPPGYTAATEQIFVEESPTTFVLEHMDSSELQVDDNEAGEEQEYKPSIDEDGNPNGVDDSNHHDESLHDSSLSHDELDEEEDISQDHDVEQQQMLQRL